MGQLAEMMERKEYAHNEIIAKEGDKFKKLVLVMLGKARILKRYHHQSKKTKAAAITLVEVQ